MQLINETDLEYRQYLRDLISGQKKFIASLEGITERLPQLTQEVAEILKTNIADLEVNQVRLRKELNRALSDKKD
jgi:hypothetical protein